MGKLDISKVLSRTFDTIGSNLTTFLILSLLFSGVPATVMTLWMSDNLVNEDPEALLAMY